MSNDSRSLTIGTAMSDFESHCMTAFNADVHVRRLVVATSITFSCLVSTTVDAADAADRALTATLRRPEQIGPTLAPRDRSVELFEEAAKVIQHPRCLNCHPRGDRPTQGDAMTPHQPLVLRGVDGFGMTAMRCTSCHQAKNFDDGRVPGNPSWHLAPLSMAWQGLSTGEICEQLRDKSRNGGKDLDALVEHMAGDKLVAWGWKPDKGRQPAPGSQAELGALVRAWVDSGAHCPAP